MPQIRRAVFVASVVLAAIVLAGCKVDASVDVDVRGDGSGTITLTVVADVDVVRGAPGLAADLRFDDATAAGWTVTPAAPTSDGGLRVVVAHPFATVDQATALLRSLNGDAGPLHDIVLTRSTSGGSATTAAVGTLRIDGGIAAFADPALLDAIGATPYAADVAASGANPGQAVSVTFRLALPGILSASTGVRDAGAVSWPVPLDGSAVAIDATGVHSVGSGAWDAVGTVALVALVLWCVLAAAFIAFVVRARRARARRRAALDAARRRS